MLTIRQFTFNPLAENTYVIFDGNKHCWIIDPGCYELAEQQELTDYIEQNGLLPKSLLNTHCHLDHVFGNKPVGDRYHLPLHIHRLEKPVLENAPAVGAGWGMPFENYGGPLVWLDDGMILTLGVHQWQVLFTPGHSQGSVSFYNAAQKMLIAGDVLFRQGVGRTDLPGGDYDTLIRSITEKLFVLPADVTVYPGHGPATTIGYEQVNNPFLSV